MKYKALVTVWLLQLVLIASGKPVVAAEPAGQAVYQYAVPVAGRTAYLWIPPRCSSIRGVIASFSNLTERKWLEDPAIRATAAELCLGTIWIGPGAESTLNADMDARSREAMQQMFRAFAQKSGFSELEYAPVISMGHSAHGQFAWRFAQVAPERTIAAIPVKTVPLPADLDLHGVPLL